jgi:hypothetical protein
MMIVDEAVDNEADANRLVRYAESRFAGNPGQVLFVVKNGSDKDNSRFIPITSQNDGDWKELHDQATGDIVVAHSWFRSLSGLDYSSGFSSERILHEYEIALNTVILSEQAELLEPIVQIIGRVLGIDASSLTIINRPPTRSKPIYMKVWEARKADGLDYDAEDVEKIVEETKLPCVIKPIDNGSSIGVYIVRTADELREALVAGLELGGHTMIEDYVAGRELSIAVLEDGALPSIEIVPKAGFYDYANKYVPGSTEEISPARIPAEAEQKLAQAAMTVFRALGLSVYSRADFILDEQGEAWFLEINTLPGMTPTSLVPQEAAAAGITYGELCEKIIADSLVARKAGK